MSGNGGTGGNAFRARDDAYDRAGYERELTAFRDVLDGPKVSAPDTAVEINELERLVTRYPDHARRLVAQLPPPMPPDR